MNTRTLTTLTTIGILSFNAGIFVGVAAIIVGAAMLAPIAAITFKSLAA